MHHHHHHHPCNSFCLRQQLSLLFHSVNDSFLYATNNSNTGGRMGRMNGVRLSILFLNFSRAVLLCVCANQNKWRSACVHASHHGIFPRLTRNITIFKFENSARWRFIFLDRPPENVDRKQRPWDERWGKREHTAFCQHMTVDPLILIDYTQEVSTIDRALSDPPLFLLSTKIASKNGPSFDCATTTL